MKPEDNFCFPNPLHKEIHGNTRRHLEGAEGDILAPEPRGAEAQSSEYHTQTRPSQQSSQQLRLDAIVERVTETRTEKHSVHFLCNGSVWDQQ